MTGGPKGVGNDPTGTGECTGVRCRRGTRTGGRDSVPTRVVVGGVGAALRTDQGRSKTLRSRVSRPHSSCQKRSCTERGPTRHRSDHTRRDGTLPQPTHRPAPCVPGGMEESSGRCQFRRGSVPGRSAPGIPSYVYHTRPGLTDRTWETPRERGVEVVHQRHRDSPGSRPVPVLRDRENDPGRGGRSQVGGVTTGHGGGDGRGRSGERTVGPRKRTRPGKGCVGGILPPRTVPEGTATLLTRKSPRTVGTRPSHNLPSLPPVLRGYPFGHIREPLLGHLSTGGRGDVSTIGVGTTQRRHSRQVPEGHLSPPRFTTFRRPDHTPLFSGSDLSGPVHSVCRTRDRGNSRWNGVRTAVGHLLGPGRRSPRGSPGPLE